MFNKMLANARGKAAADTKVQHEETSARLCGIRGNDCLSLIADTARGGAEGAWCCVEFGLCSRL
jgi:hypothetical protein